MIKELFTLTLCTMLFTQLQGFANINIKNDIYSTRTAVKIHGSRQHSAQRSQCLFPAQVFLIDHLLTAESLEFESDFKVFITNLSTGKIVYEQTYSASTKYATIDLDTEEAGDYKIELSSVDWMLYGYFSL